MNDKLGEIKIDLSKKKFVINCSGLIFGTEKGMELSNEINSVLGRWATNNKELE